VLYGVLYGKAKDLDLKIHTAGNVKDHIHIVISIPPKIAIADGVRHLKGASAFSINHMQVSDGQFKWQAGYGALTVSEDSLATAAHYAAHQKEHHQSRTIMDVYERMEAEE
jgi:putative transposase